MAFADANDVQTELGRSPASDAESDQWEAWLDRVERSIRRRFRRAGLDLDQQITAGDPTAEDVIDIEVARVIDKIQNPNRGQTSITKSVDDSSVTYRREGDSADADPLELTESEWDALLPEFDDDRGAFSIRPSFEPDCRGSWLWPA